MDRKFFIYIHTNGVRDVSQWIREDHGTEFNREVILVFGEFTDKLSLLSIVIDQQISELNNTVDTFVRGYEYDEVALFNEFRIQAEWVHGLWKMFPESTKHVIHDYSLKSLQKIEKNYSDDEISEADIKKLLPGPFSFIAGKYSKILKEMREFISEYGCLLYTSPSPRD